MLRLPGRPAAADLPADWPHRAHSRWVTAGGLRWHVQLFGPPPGSAPALLLLHGTGASTHSWRDFIPPLQRRLPGVTLLAPDLPGHAYTSRPAQDLALGLPGMAAALGALLAVLGGAGGQAEASDPRAAQDAGPAAGAAAGGQGPGPHAGRGHEDGRGPGTRSEGPAPQPLALLGLIGHSAGAAIAARLWLDGHLWPGTASAVLPSAPAGLRQGAAPPIPARPAPPVLVSLNGAWFPPAGLSGSFYSPMAKLLARNRLVPHVFAWQAARPAALRRLIDSTGSALDASGHALYARLVAQPAHVGAVLAMMAQWDLSPLLRDLPRLGAAPRPLQLHLVAAEADTTVPPHQAVELASRVPGARLHLLPGLGHLAHEEAPGAVAGLVAGLVGAVEQVRAP